MNESISEHRRIRLDPSQATRSWPVRLTGLLLVMEAVIIVTIHVLNLSDFDWNVLLAADNDVIPDLPDAALLAVAVALLFVPSVFLSVLAAIGLFFIWRTGWMLAILTQGLTLAICLVLNLQDKPGIIYPIMLVSILLVLNLNSFEVRAAVHDRPNRPGTGRSADGN